MAATHPFTALRYDLFASHAHEDARAGHVSAFLERLRTQFLHEFPGEALTDLLDTGDIHTGDDWQRRLRGEVQQSLMFLAFLSPAHFASEWCLREWLDHEISLHILSEGVFPIYFVEIPELTAGLSEQAIAHILAALRGAQVADVQRHYAAKRG